MEKNWLLQSERDLITAKNCTKSGDFYASAFFCHQTIEKCLKALYISGFDDLPPKTHHIDKLAILLEAPIKFILFGSRVWGKPDEFSNIDLILVSNEFKIEKFAGRMGKVLQELKFHEHIDALCYTKEEFERKLKESYIVRDAVKKGYNVI